MFHAQSHVGYWEGRGHVKCLALDMRQSDDDAFQLPVLRDGPAYFAILPLLGS